MHLLITAIIILIFLIFLELFVTINYYYIILLL